MTTRPISATSVWTGVAGVLAGTAAAFALHGWEQPDYVRTVVVMLCVAVPMLLVELVVNRPHRSVTTGLSVRPVNPLNLVRIGQKLVGFWATVGVIGAAYWALPEYANDFYAPFRNACLLCLPLLAVLAPIYIWYVDRRQFEPHDAYVEVYRLIAGERPANWSMLLHHASGWLVKAFFLPLMFVFLNSSLRAVWSGPAVPSFENFSEFYEYCYSGLFMWDVMLAAVGYVLTLRLFDSHIRSVEPSMLGWVVCLLCYPPFWDIMGRSYFAYDRDQLYWGHFFNSVPLLYVAWGCVILVLVGVYVWATMSFGIRFSNLTHRGIITTGPYRWVKHPAYLSKNLTWWMISVPFFSVSGVWTGLQASLLLLGVNGVYYARALTEERHLARDPAYREYQAFIAEHGLWAQFRRVLGGTRSRARGGLGPLATIANDRSRGGRPAAGAPSQGGGASPATGPATPPPPAE